GDIAEVVGGGTPRTNDPTNFEAGDVPWVTPADLSGYREKFIAHGARFITRKGLESSSARLLPAGAVLFTSRAPVGYVAIARNPVATNQGFKSFVLKDCVLPEYVYWWLKGSKQRAEALASGTTFLELSGANAKKLPIPIRSVDEQRRIVAEIEKQFSRLDEAVANLKRVKANLARFANGVLSAAVAGRLVATELAIGEARSEVFESGTDLLQRVLVARKQLWSGRGQYSDPSIPDTRGLSALPKGWTWASADQISDFITKGTTPASSKLSEGAGDVQFLKVYNLTFDGSLNHTYKPAFVSRDTHEKDLARSKVRPGDVLINIVGPPLGQVSLVPTELPEANINQAIARIRPVGPLSTRYIALALMAPEVMDWAVRRAKTTAGQSNLTLELCRAIPIPLPPLAEQLRIVAEVDRRLSIVREVEAEVDANLKRAQALRQAVLARAFKCPASRAAEERPIACAGPGLAAGLGTRERTEE
ncbi:MAG: restriction endonuclease subunit S, partial [Rhizobacter sp.]|nr:restriction endonuclease subunit S [Rhizobacter sp.]